MHMNRLVHINPDYFVYRVGEKKNPFLTQTLDNFISKSDYPEKFQKKKSNHPRSAIQIID